MNRKNINSRIGKDTFKLIIGNLAPMITALICIPYLLNHLGDENYGILVLAWALIGYLGLFDFGIGKSATYFISNAITKNSINIHTIVHSGLLFALSVSFFGLLMILLIFYMWVWFDSTILIYKESVFIISATIIPTVLTVYFRGVIEGFHKFTISSISKAAFGSLMFLAPSLMVYIGISQIEYLLISLLLSRIVVLFYLMLNLKEFFTKLVPSVECMKEIFNYGSWVSISGIIGPIMVYGDRFFITYFFGAVSLPVYAISQEILQRLLIIPGSFSSAILPKISLIKAKNHKESYKRSLFVTSVIMMLVCTVVAIIFPLFLEFWISAEFAEKATNLSYIIIIGIFFNSLAHSSFTFLYAIKRTKEVAIVHIFELIFYIVLLIISIKIFGFIGVAIAWSIRCIVDFIALHIIVIKRIKNYV